MDLLSEYYGSRDEDSRLLSRVGRVEYLTTMKYIKEYLESGCGKRILEVGAGTGRYSVTLARMGYCVTAVELVEHNIDVLKGKLDGSEDIEVFQGNALDLSRFEDGSFDMTLVLGPLYHLYTKADKLRALHEAVRVTKPGGVIMAAYCMNEATIIQYCFMGGNLSDEFAKEMISPDWHCKSEPKEIFELIRTEEIAELDAELDVTRAKLIATDGAAHYHRAMLEEMDDATYQKWLDFHFATCERQDLVGASNHTLDILIKN